MDTNRHSTKTEEDRALDIIVPHGYCYTKADGAWQCTGEPTHDRSDRPGDCDCGALRRRQVLEWALESANANGYIKSLERLKELAGRSREGLVILSPADCDAVIKVSQHQFAGKTADQPEWLVELLISAGLAG